MSAILAVVQKNSVSALSDGGLWTPDGALASVERKIVQVGPCAVLVGRGDAATLDALTHALGNHWRLDDLQPLLAKFLAQSLRPGHTAEVFLAGWSDAHDEPQLWWMPQHDRVASAPRGSCKRLREYCSPIPDSTQWVKAGVRKITDPDFDLAADGLELFEIMRATRATMPGVSVPVHLVAGHAELATVTRGGVVKSIIRRWDDKAGEPVLRDSTAVEAEEVLFTYYEDDDSGSLTDRVIIIDSDTNDFNLRTVHDAVFPAIVDPYGLTLTCIIQAGVKVGASTTAARAFDVGSWPADLDITVQVLGRIQGCGGRGSDAKVTGPVNGSPGGPALYTRYPISLDVDAGEIFGGGGGGGAGQPVGNAAAGGGGAGQVPGLGGSPLGSNTPGSPGTTEAGGAPGSGFFAGAAGGGPGLAGGTAPGSSPPGGTGGAAGAAIDGVSYVTVTEGPGDRRGGEIN